MAIKKITSVFVTLVLLVGISPFALAQGIASIEIYGNVAAKNSYSVSSPAEGLLKDYSLTLGDRVHEGDSLFTLETKKVYAPFAGTVRGLTVALGENVDDATSRYGAPLYIEPAEAFTLQASTAQGYNEKENKVVLPGQKVYLLSTGNKDRSATGIITQVSGQTFTVETDSEQNTLDPNERVGIYRESSHDAKTRLGYGITSQTPLVTVTGSGTVVALHVQEGSVVEKGTLLFETLTSSIYGVPVNTNSITAPSAGIITALPISSSTLVSANQLLITIADDSELEIIAYISADDYGAVSVGDTVLITFDSYDDLSPLEGTVSSIAAYSSTSQGEKEYALTIDFVAPHPLPLDLEATVTLNP